MHINAYDIKQRASGYWAEIIYTLAPQLATTIERGRRHWPCNLCGGVDRCRCHNDFAETGGIICNQCGGGADGFAVLCWANDWTFTETLEAVSKYLSYGIGGSYTVTKAKSSQPKDWTGEHKKIKKLWEEVYPELSEGKAGLLGAVTARAEAQVMRLSCLYALLDLSDTIRLEHLSAGLALWAYCEDSAKYIFGETLGDPLADEIKRVLDGEPNGLTQTELSNHFKRHKKSEQLNRGLNILIARGMVFKVGEETSGRTSHRYFFSQNYRRNN